MIDRIVTSNCEALAVFKSERIADEYISEQDGVDKDTLYSVFTIPVLN